MRLIPFACLALSLIACGSPEAVQLKDSLETVAHEEVGTPEEARNSARPTEAEDEVSAQACVNRCSGGLYAAGLACSFDSQCPNGLCIPHLCIPHLCMNYC